LECLWGTEVDWEAWEGRFGVLVGNLRTTSVVYWVTVSDSSGARSPGLSGIKPVFSVVVGVAVSFVASNAFSALTLLVTNRKGIQHVKFP